MAGVKNRTVQADATGKQIELLVQLLKLSSFINGPMQDGVASPNKLALNELKIALCLGREGALAGHDIAEIMGIAPMNVSRSLSSLLQRGWIEPAPEILSAAAASRFSSARWAGKVIVQWSPILAKWQCIFWAILVPKNAHHCFQYQKKLWAAWLTGSMIITQACTFVIQPTVKKWATCP